MSFLELLLDYKNYMPHGYCFLWFPELVWLHFISDLVTAVSYFSIPIILFYIAYKKHQVIKFKWVFVLFGAFIFLCGLTHVMDIITLWYPLYMLQGVIKAITAAVSIATAVSLIPLVPLLFNTISNREDKAKK